jgi:hypothetical protein
LPKAYTAHRGARVLTTTAELTSNTKRRIAETGQMLLDITAPAGPHKPFDSKTIAYRATRGVRVFHAAIRRMLLNDPDVNWDVEKLGVPINQEDLLGTLATFTVVVMESLEQMGVRCTDADRNAYLHLWLVVGHFLGIDYNRLRPAGRLDTADQPLTYFEMQVLRDAVFRRNAAASVGGQMLTRALLDESRAALPWFLATFPAAATRRLLGEEAANLLEVPLAGATRVLFLAMRPMTQFLQPVLKVSGLVSARATRRMYKRWIREGRGSRPPWRIEHVQQRWRLPAPESA